MEVAACAFEYQLLRLITKGRPSKFSLGSNPQKTLSKSFKFLEVGGQQSVSSVWLTSALSVPADRLNGRTAKAEALGAGDKSEEYLEGGKKQLGHSPISLPYLRYGDIKQCEIILLPKEYNQVIFLATHKCSLVLNSGIKECKKKGKKDITTLKQ